MKIYAEKTTVYGCIFKDLDDQNLAADLLLT